MIKYINRKVLKINVNYRFSKIKDNLKYNLMNNIIKNKFINYDTKYFNKFCSYNNWNIKENKDTNLCELNKKYLDNEIFIYFYLNKNFPDINKYKFENNLDLESMKIIFNTINFYIYIKNKNNKIIHFDALSIDDTLSFFFVKSVENWEKNLKNLTSLNENRDIYRGQSFQVYHKHKDLYLNYLNSLTINDVLCYNINKFIIFKEKRLYMEWYENIYNFIKNN